MQAVVANFVSAQQINSLTHIDDINPIGESDQSCLAEVYQVFKRHGALKRFGISLLHKHFDLHEGEVLLEKTDEAKRITAVYVGRARDLVTSENIDVIHTNIMFTESEDPAGIVTYGYTIGCGHHGYGRVIICAHAPGESCFSLEEVVK